MHVHLFGIKHFLVGSSIVLFFLSVIAVHPISVHVFGGQGSAPGIRVFWSVSLVGSPIESRGIR